MIDLVRVVRSGFWESTHAGAVVITDPAGDVEFAVGSVDHPIFPRSSNKPFQAMAMLDAGALLAGADLALASASHSGERMHTDRVQGMLDAAGFTESDLACPEAWPLNEARRNDVIRVGGSPKRLYMNCSGKHAGMLTACRVAGWDPARYLAVDHPLQQRVGEIVAEMSGETPTSVGIDGCGAPLFAITLTGLARAFGRLTSAAVGTAARTVADAMRSHPEMVGGTGRDDTLLMQGIPGLLTKAGAEGVHTAALADGRAIALKIADGNERARTPVLIGALRLLGVTAEVLGRFEVSPVLGGGVPVGVVELIPGALDRSHARSGHAAAS